MPLHSQKTVVALRTTAPRQASGTRTPQPAPIKTRRGLARVMWHSADAPPAIIERLWAEPDELISSAAMLKDGDRCTVVRLELVSETAKGALEPEMDSSLRHATLKRYNLKDRAHTAVHALLRSRARWSWLNAQQLIAAKVPTPTPIACLEERVHGVLRRRSYLLSAFIPGRSLLELIMNDEATGAQMIELAKQFVRIWQTLGQMRAGHGDMKATNFIVDPHGKLWLIDLDGLRFYRTATMLRRERRNDLTRFMRNWQARPEVAAVFRARIGTG